MSAIVKVIVTHVTPLCHSVPSSLGDVLMQFADKNLLQVPMASKLILGRRKLGHGLW